MVGALTLNYIAEAVGITQAAQDHGLPVAILFTVEIDGKLPTGESPQTAVEVVYDAAAGSFSHGFVVA